MVAGRGRQPGVGHRPGHPLGGRQVGGQRLLHEEGQPGGQHRLLQVAVRERRHAQPHGVRPGAQQLVEVVDGRGRRAPRPAPRAPPRPGRRSRRARRRRTRPGCARAAPPRPRPRGAPPARSSPGPTLASRHLAHPARSGTGPQACVPTLGYPWPERVRCGAVVGHCVRTTGHSGVPLSTRRTGDAPRCPTADRPARPGPDVRRGLRVLMDAGPWLPVPPTGYGGLENVVATLTTELRRRGHEVVLATVGESEPACRRPRLRRSTRPVRAARRSRTPTSSGSRTRTSTPSSTRSAGRPRPARRSTWCTATWRWSGRPCWPALGDRRRRSLHTLHWDLRRNAEFYATFDGGGRVFFAGVSQLADRPGSRRAAPADARRGAAGRPAARGRRPLPRDERDGLRARAVPDLRAQGHRHRGAGLPGGRACRWCWPARSAGIHDRAVAGRAPWPTRPSPVRDHPDVRLVPEHVAPQLDGDAVPLGRAACPGAAKDDLLRRARAVLFPVRWPEPGGTAVCEALAAGHAGRRDGPWAACPRWSTTASPASWPRTRPSSPPRWAGSTSSTRRPAPTAARRRFAPAVMAEGYERLYAEGAGADDDRGAGQPPRPRPAWPFAR